MPANVNTFIRTESADDAWHSVLTAIMPDGTMPSEALQVIGEVPYTLQDVAIIMPDGSFNNIGKPMLVRGKTSFDDSYVPYHVVSDHYELFSMSEIAEIIDPLSEKWGLNCAGVLLDGQKTFFTLDMGTTWLQDMENEQYRRFCMIGQDYGKNGGIIFVVSQIRVVCNNTFIASTQYGKLQKITQNRYASDLLKFRSDLELGLIEAQEGLEKSLTAMMKAKPDGDDVNRIIESFWQLPSVPTQVRMASHAPKMVRDKHERVMTKVEKDLNQWLSNCRSTMNARIGTAENYARFNDEHPALAGTVYALVQSANEYANHYTGRGRASSEEHREMSKLFGVRHDQINHITRTGNRIMAGDSPMTDKEYARQEASLDFLKRY